MFIFGWIWNVLLTIIIIALFVPWWGFVFGTGLIAILILIFDPMLFLLPIGLSIFYWSE